MRTVLTALAFIVAADVAQADPKPSDAAMMQRLLKRIEQDNRECNVGMSYAGRIAVTGGTSSARFDGALVLIYSVDGCGGGNNWGSTVQVYGVKDDIAVEIVQAAELVDSQRCGLQR